MAKQLLTSLLRCNKPLKVGVWHRTPENHVQEAPSIASVFKYHMKSGNKGVCMPMWPLSISPAVTVRARRKGWRGLDFKSGRANNFKFLSPFPTPIPLLLTDSHESAMQKMHRWVSNMLTNLPGCVYSMTPVRRLLDDKRANANRCA